MSDQWGVLRAQNPRNKPHIYRSWRGVTGGEMWCAKRHDDQLGWEFFRLPGTSMQKLFADIARRMQAAEPVE